MDNIKITLIQDIDISREGRLIEWYKNYEKLSQFIDKNDRLPEEGEENNISEWISEQRQRRTDGRITRDQIKKLQNLKYWYWNMDIRWMTNYDKLKNFISENNRLPNYNIRNEKFLGNWVVKQRYYYTKDRLTPSKILLLQKFECWSWTYKKRGQPDNFSESPTKRIKLEDSDTEDSDGL